VPTIARATLELARPYARELGSDAALEGIERILSEGNGAFRQRQAFAAGGMPAVLAELVAETERSAHLVGTAHHRHVG
jgi:gamma-glutamyl:cysteine ligase YbdK (ATP-grasp superfamily)